VFWRRSRKFLFVLEPKRKERTRARRPLARVRTAALVAAGLMVVIWSVGYERTKLKRRQAAVDIMRLRELAGAFVSERGACPEGLDELLAAEGPAEALDPWGRKYELVCPGKRTPPDSDVFSAGPDRTLFTQDDVRIE